MKQILPACIALIFFTVISSSVSAQPETTGSSYTDAAGIRLGPTSPAIQNGITYKHFLNPSAAIEGILSLSNGFGICGLYEIHKSLNVENVQWFIGGGGYVAFVNSRNYFGGAGIIGIDYKFPSVPINLSIDWKPELNLAPNVFFEGSGVGFSARYTFGK